MPTEDPKIVRYAPVGDGRYRTTYSDGTELVVNPSSFQRLTDSGQISAFRPALYVKPQRPIERISRAWNAFLGKPNPSQTSEQGASSAASPVTYYLSLWEQRLGRRARIEDTRSLYLSDSRVFRSTNMYVDEALRGGPKIRVQGKDRKAKKAAEIAKAVEKIYNASLIQEWGKGLIIEGDLFIQHVVQTKGGDKRLVQAVAMPSVGMERLTNDADQFVHEDGEPAFEQIDSMTFTTVAQFPASLMTHTRWSKVNGDRYGTSELCTARRVIRALELMEQAVMINRMVRAPIRRFHSVGSENNTGSAQEIQQYKAENLYYKGKLEAFNPLTTMVDYVGNGNTKVETLTGDPNIGRVEDLSYIQDVMMAALPTPGPFFGLAIEFAKRDVLDDMRKLWVRSHTKIQEAIAEPVKHGFELACTLAGIDPASIDYSVQWLGGGLETPDEIAEYLVVAKDGGIMSQKTAVEKWAQVTGVTDIDQEIKDIKSTEDDAHAKEVEKRGAGKTIQDQMDDEGGPGVKAKKPVKPKGPKAAEDSISLVS